MLKMSNVSKKFKTKNIETTALDSIDLDIKEGSFVSIVGASGCGKSTLLNTIGLLEFPSSGQYSISGSEVLFGNKKRVNELRLNTFSFVFQSFYLVDELSVFDNVMLGLKYRKLDDKKDRVSNILKKLKIDHRANHYPFQLSGGQQQRCAIGRALVSNPKVILADEPTGNLDKDSSNNVMDLFSDLNKNGVTIMMVTHSEALAAKCGRVIRMDSGKIIEDVI